MFLGELSVFGAYGAKKIMLKRQNKLDPAAHPAPMSPGAIQAGEKQRNINPSPFILAIPALFDFTASSLMFVALTMTPASVYQMMRGFVTVITALLSIFLLKKKQHSHHWLGLGCVVLALVEVGYVSIALGEPEDGLVGSVPLGIALLLIAQCFVGGLFIVEEYFLGDYYLDPLKVVGSEGMWGVLYWCISLPLMQLVKCEMSLCNFDYLENSAYAFQQMADEPVLIVYTVGIMISIAFFNVCGVTTTKLASAAQRSTVDTSRTVLIWMGSVALGFEKFQWQAIPGFILLVFGTLVYNEILVLPFWGLDKNTKVALSARDGAKKRDMAYMQTSPGAAYSSQRNQRLLMKADDEHYDVPAGKDDDIEYKMNASDNQAASDK